MRTNECVNYILSLSSKESIQQADKEKLNKIKEKYDSFYRNVCNDTSINGIDNINSLGLSYPKSLVQKHIPEAKIKSKLFWRYSLVWEKLQA